MKKNLRLVILACALAGSPLAFAQSSSTASSPGGRMDQGSQQMHQSLKVGMQKMHGHMTGDTDQDFATMMRMHHQHGVEMAKAEVQKREVARTEGDGSENHRGPAEGNQPARCVAGQAQVAREA